MLHHHAFDIRLTSDFLLPSPMRKGKKLFTNLIWWCNKVWQLPTLEIIQNHFGHCIDISFATLRRMELKMDQLSSGRKRNEINVSFMRQGTTSATESKFYSAETIAFSVAFRGWNYCFFRKIRWLFITSNSHALRQVSPAGYPFVRRRNERAQCHPTEPQT